MNRSVVIGVESEQVKGFVLLICAIEEFLDVAVNKQSLSLHVSIRFKVIKSI